MACLVTGGAGFLGCWLTDSLLDAGHRVTVLDDFSSGSRANLDHRLADARLTVIQADLTEPLPPLAGTFDRVYHLASPASPADYGAHPIETLRVNAIGTEQILRLAANHGARFVLASTSEVYGDPLVHPQPETYHGNVNPVGPRSCYDEGKRFAESLTASFVRVHGLDARIARIFNTYGPRSRPGDGRVVPNFCMQALTGVPLTLHGDGRQTRALCYVDDLIRGLVSLMETDGLGGEVINLGSAEEITIADLAARVLMLAGRSPGIIRTPLPTDDPIRRCPDITKAGRLLGWTPSIELNDGLTKTLAAFRAGAELVVHV